MGVDTLREHDRNARPGYTQTRSAAIAGCSERPQQVKQAEVEVKVEQRSDFPHLNLSLSLNLLLTLTDFANSPLDGSSRIGLHLHGLKGYRAHIRRYFMLDDTVVEGRFTNYHNANT